MAVLSCEWIRHLVVHSLHHEVQVSLGARVPIPAGNGHVEYRDLRLNTTVRLAPGKKVVLWEKGEQKLTLSMEKVGK